MVWSFFNPIGNQFFNKLQDEIFHALVETPCSGGYFVAVLPFVQLKWRFIVRTCIVRGTGENECPNFRFCLLRRSPKAKWSYTWNLTLKGEFKGTYTTRTCLLTVYFSHAETIILDRSTTLQLPFYFYLFYCWRSFQLKKHQFTWFF